MRDNFSRIFYYSFSVNIVDMYVDMDVDIDVDMDVDMDVDLDVDVDVDEEKISDHFKCFSRGI